MKRSSLLLLTAALLLSAACKSESRPDAAANANTSSADLVSTPGASGQPGAQPTPPPGTVEVNTSTLTKDVERNPEDLTARYNLGTAYLVEGKPLEAAEQFKYVAEKKPDDADALDKLGMAYTSANRFDEAADAYRRALRRQPQSAYLHQALADVYEKLGKTAEAAAERAEFQRLDPNVRAKTLLAAGRFKEAADEARKVSPANAETHYVRGNALLNLKQPAEALASYQQSIKLNPKYADAYFQSGNAYDQMNQQEAAAKAFQAAARLNPKDADAFYNLGNTYNKLNRPKEAAEAFAQAVRLRPEDAEARVRLAVAQLRQGNTAAAREQQEALKKLDPGAAAQLQQAIEQGVPKAP